MTLRRVGSAVSEDLDLDVAIWRFASRIEFDPNLARQRSQEPQGVVLGPAHVHLPAIDPPCSSGLPIRRAYLGTIEVVGKAGPDAGIALRSAACEKPQPPREPNSHQAPGRWRGR
jgi:hypothetical protein